MTTERDLELRTHECPLRAALEDSQDFIDAIVSATEGGGDIDKNSVMRFGERLKTTARKLRDKNRKALAANEGPQAFSPNHRPRRRDAGA